MGWGTAKVFCGCGKKLKKNGTCPRWGCKAKTKAQQVISDAGSTKRKDGSNKNSLYDAKGRNVNGIRYDDNGKRIWDNN